MCAPNMLFLCKNVHTILSSIAYIQSNPLKLILESFTSSSIIVEFSWNFCNEIYLVSMHNNIFCSVQLCQTRNTQRKR